MAIYEKNGVFNYLDASGNQNILYPVTKSDNVDGLDDELALKVNVADVVNNLTSSDTNKPLSAKQGKALQDGKQAKLVSGTNIKTINGVSILGSGDMTTPIPTASASTLGGVKIGSGINVTTEGVISAQSYSLPTASASVKGGVKIGSGLKIANEVASVDTSVVQAKLVSGTSIKTINGTSLLGSGDITTGMAIDLLWTNASHTSSFGAQTISLNLADYEKFIISAKADHSDDLKNIWYYFGLKNQQFKLIGFRHPTIDNNPFKARYCLFTDNGVTFSNGYYSSTANSDSLIPYTIYGIK